MEIKKCRSLNTSVIKWKKKQCHLVSQAFLDKKKQNENVYRTQNIFFYGSNVDLIQSSCSIYKKRIMEFQILIINHHY